MRKTLCIGLDFDGVVAYNPFRVVRSPITYVKRKLFGVRKLSFYYPKNSLEKIFWIILHESSIFPAVGTDLLKDIVKKKNVKIYLITARYSFLDQHLDRWLSRYNMKHIFTSIYTNKNNEQPHIFKEKMIKKLNIDIFVEDNWDIVNYLDSRNIASIYWIYNVLDRGIPFKNKFPYLEKALRNIPRLLSPNL